MAEPNECCIAWMESPKVRAWKSLLLPELLVVGFNLWEEPLELFMGAVSLWFFVGPNASIWRKWRQSTHYDSLVQIMSSGYLEG